MTDDDDLLLCEHAAEISRHLVDADFAHPPSARILADGELEFLRWKHDDPDKRLPLENGVIPYRLTRTR